MMTLGVSVEEPDPFRQRQALIDAARAGDAHAQFLLGDVYRVGDEYTEQDFVEAVRWYRLAAKQGDACAQNNLGAMYQHAMGVAYDPAEAARWYRAAAVQGLDVAEFNMAMCYLHGAGVEQNDELAVALLDQAANQGHREAIGQMGTCFRFDRGVKQDIIVAAQLHVIAAQMGDVTSTGNLADYRIQIEQQAFGGSLRAALSLARMYKHGLGVDSSPLVGCAWLLLGASHGISDNDAVALCEQYDLSEEFLRGLSAEQRDAAYALFEQMRLQSGQL
jgi:TPR repeat protein